MILFLRTALKVSPLALCPGLTDLTLQITQFGRSRFRTMESKQKGRPVQPSKSRWKMSFAKQKSDSRR